MLSWFRKAQTPGERGERVAERYLRRRKFKPLARNLRNAAGEIDLVMLTPDRKTLVIVEVKTSDGRTSAIAPEHRVGPKKQRKLTTLAYQLKQKHAAQLDGLGMRFDVVGVDLCDGKKPEVRHYEHAFEAAWQGVGHCAAQRISSPRWNQPGRRPC